MATTWHKPTRLGWNTSAYPEDEVKKYGFPYLHRVACCHARVRGNGETCRAFGRTRKAGVVAVAVT